MTKDLERMLSDPRKAIVSMSVPLLVGFLVTNVQLFIDSFWCAGLGSAAMAAINVSGPVYWIVTDIGMGLGVGVSTAIARALGANDRSRADRVLSQMVVFTVLFSFAVMAVMFVIAGPLLRYMSNSADIGLCMEYVTPNILFSMPLIFNGIFLGSIRGEGAAKKSTAVSISASVINMVLDPIFIYGFGWGIAGASLATCISFTVTMFIVLYWYRSDRMYLRLSFSGFCFQRDVMFDVFVVGIPHTLELVLVPLMMVPQNAIVMRTGGDAGIICATLPFRYITLASIPAQALTAAMIPVASAALGQRNSGKVRECYRYTQILALSVATALSLFLLVFADPLSAVFTNSGDMVQYREEFAKVLRIYAFVTVEVAMIDVGSAVLQTLRAAPMATFSIFFREVMFIALYYVSSFYGMDAIYWSMLVAQLVGASMMVGFAGFEVRRRLNTECSC